LLQAFSEGVNFAERMIVLVDRHLILFSLAPERSFNALFFIFKWGARPF